MKKILLLILGVSFLNLTANAQSNTDLVYEDNKIKVETINGDCNYYNQTISHTYSFLKYTNKTQNPIMVDFNLDLSYNGVQQNTSNSDKPENNIMELGPNESIEGDCNSKEDFLRVLHKHNHPKMDINLTKIQFTINKIK